MSVERLRYVANYVDIQLRDMPMGCSLFRSTRSTHGFDIIVMDGTDAALKQSASNRKTFGADGHRLWGKTI